MMRGVSDSYRRKAMQRRDIYRSVGRTEEPGEQRAQSAEPARRR